MKHINLDRIHVLKPGTYPGRNGEVKVTPQIISELAETYNPALSEAPLVIGHPKFEDAAMGWIENLEVVGNNLFVNTKKVATELSEAVEAGKYKNVSIAFYNPTTPGNPVPGKCYVKHLGFLGAMSPAVKGLQPVAEFAELEDGIDCALIELCETEAPAPIITPVTEFSLADAAAARKLSETEFSELAEYGGMTPEALAQLEDSLFAKIAQLKQRELNISYKEQSLKQAEIDAQWRKIEMFAEGEVVDGRLLPKDKMAFVEMCKTLSGEEAVVELAEGEKQATLDWFMGYHRARPVVVELGEMSSKAQPSTKAWTDTKLAERMDEIIAEYKKQGKTIDVVAALKIAKSEK